MRGCASSWRRDVRRAPRTIRARSCSIWRWRSHWGDCLADLALVRAQPQLFGRVASDPTVSRLVATLAADAPAALHALPAARAAARARVWQCGAPVGEDGPVILDLDATLVEAHSEKEGAAATWKRGFGFHPLLAFLDHGPGGTGECVGALLRPGTATANNAGDHIAVLAEALDQLPAQVRDRVLVRADSGGGVHAFLDHLHARGLRYSIGLMGYQPVLDALDALPRQAWKAALDEHGRPREGAQVAELTRYLPPTYKPWPDGMRVIARRERPHPGAQLRITHRDGWRITCFATNVPGGRLAEHERRHRLRARAEDRIRCLKDTGLRNLPLHDFTANQIWLELVALAADLLAWTQLLHVRRAEPDLPLASGPTGARLPAAGPDRRGLAGLPLPRAVAALGPAARRSHGRLLPAPHGDLHGEPQRRRRQGLSRHH